MTERPPRHHIPSVVDGTRAVIRALWKQNALVDASAMAFSLFLAGIPLMGLAGTVIAHLLHGEPRAVAAVSALLDLAPGEVRGLVDRHVARGGNQSIAPLFLLGSLWLAASAFQDAMTVFEAALGARPRSWLRKRVIALGCVVALLVGLALVGFVTLTLLGGPLAVILAVAERTALLSGMLPPLVAVGVTWVLTAAFFRIAVRHTSKRPAIWPGATATVALGALASALFAFYAQSLASYALFYGSLAAVAVFLVWLWLCCIALLVGVEVNALVEHGRSPL